MNIIECIEMLIQEKNISMYKLAQNAGISQSILSNLINRGNAPSIITLKKICDGLEISLSEFFFILEESSRNINDEYNELIRKYILLGETEREYLNRTIQLLLTRRES